MLFQEPHETPYDLNFKIFKVPVRVHPLHWVIGAILLGGAQPHPLYLLMSAAVVFVSVLVHELGHVFAMQTFGTRARVLLYGFGGLAIPENSMWGRSRGKASSTVEQVIISGAGPAAGFGLAALVVLIVNLTGGFVAFELGPWGLPSWTIELDRTLVPMEALESLPEDERVRQIAKRLDPGSERLVVLINMLLFANIWWGLFNLLPIFPLDGGQISRALFVHQDPWNGMRKSLVVSMFAAGGVAALFFYQQNMFTGLFMASLAYGSYQALQGGGVGRGW
jgi:stage IV sporulation protein FB